MEINLILIIIYQYFHKLQGGCRFKDGKLDGKPYNGPIYKISSFIWVKQGDDKALIEVLDKYGPVAVAIDASHPSFVSYANYVYGENQCSKKNIGTFSKLKIKNNFIFYVIFYIKLDHAALLVGYEDLTGSDGQVWNYWKIRCLNYLFKYKKLKIFIKFILFILKGINGEMIGFDI